MKRTVLQGTSLGSKRAPIVTKVSKLGKPEPETDLKTPNSVSPQKKTISEIASLKSNKRLFGQFFFLYPDKVGAQFIRKEKLYTRGKVKA